MTDAPTTATAATPVDDHKAARSATVRLRVLTIGMMVMFATVCLRLVQIQIVDSEELRAKAQRQYRAKVIMPATRGNILDRNGNLIASNSMFVSFAADPKLAQDHAQAIARRFADVFGKPQRFYLDKLRSDSRFVWLERQVDVALLDRLKPKSLAGLVVLPEPKRLYHNDHTAGQLVGTTDIDNHGLAGSELWFDGTLSGVDGYVVFQRDGLGRARAAVDYPRVDPQNGNDVELTIDLKIQSIAERELRRGIEQSNAESGIVVILQPRTGEVLALAQYPMVDPNQFGRYAAADQKLRAITDVFEPGSVFKIVTASAALEHHLVAPERTFFAENGVYVVPISSTRTRRIVDTHKSGWITFRDAMAYSSNIVMAKVSDIIGSERLYKMARDYGFGIPTNIEFPGEVRGTLKKPMEWSGTTLNTIAFGYEVGATPLQIAAAYAAVANGGVLMKPYLLKREVDPAGNIVRSTTSQPIRRVVSEATARTLTEMFEGVVDHGTGTAAAIRGITIAGKTGTSKKLVDGKYAGNYTASFVGFFPAEDPQIVCLVMMDNPRGPSYTGGLASAPVFRAIAERMISTSEIFASMPMRIVQASDAPQRPTEPTANRRSENRTPPERAGVSVEEDNNGDFVPDVTGYSVRKAVSVLMAEQLEPVVNGSGIVIQQLPGAGQRARSGTRVILTCEPKALASRRTE
jgi:cell division protein FtsI (penicillin-binding protein 3)